MYVDYIPKMWIFDLIYLVRKKKKQTEFDLHTFMVGTFAFYIISEIYAQYVYLNSMFI